jgi:biotin transport system substrate-specific component
MQQRWLRQGLYERELNMHFSSSTGRSNDADQRSLAAILTLPETLAGQVFLAIGASVLVAICAHIALPLPFTPVPLVLSDLAVLAIGLTLGPVTAFSAMMLYLAEGAIGLPVFSPAAGPSGPLHLIGPSGGFLLAYPVVALVAGAVAQWSSRRVSRFSAGVIAATVATLVLFAVGATWLASVAHLGLNRALQLAVLPFLFGNLAKVVAAAGIYSGVQRWRRS